MVNVRMFAGRGLILGVLLAAPAVVPAAQEQSPPATQQPRQTAPKKVMKGGNVERRMQHLATRLDLTEEQKVKIRPILEEETAKIDALRDDAAVSRVERRAKLQEIRDAVYERINKVLTPEQQKKHEELRKLAQKKRPAK